MTKLSKIIIRPHFSSAKILNSTLHFNFCRERDVIIRFQTFHGFTNKRFKQYVCREKRSKLLMSCSDYTRAQLIWPNDFSVKRNEKKKQFRTEESE